MKRSKFFWRVNHDIRADEVRVIGADGNQLGVLKLGEAVAKAKEANLDLVEIAPNAIPPVTKIVDLGKFRYQEEKKLRKQKTKGGELKEVRLSPFIAENDYNTRLARVREFLEDKNKVRVVVVFKGRQMGSKNFGYELLRKVLADLGEGAKQESDPKFIGRHLAMTVTPLSQKPKEKEENAETKDSKISS